MARAAGSTVGGLAGRSALPSAAMAVVGALFAVLFHPALGLPIAGAALGGLLLRREHWLTAFALCLAAALATLLAEGSIYVIAVPLTGVPVTARAPFVYVALMLASLVAVGPAAVALLRRRAALESVVLLAVVLVVLQLGALALFAAGAGWSLADYVAGAMKALASQAGVDEEIGRLLVGMWPGVLVTTSVVTAFLAIAGVGRAAQRQGIALNRIPPLPTLDLDPRTVVLPILAVALLAAGRFVQEGVFLTAAGNNVLVVARWVFFLQGVAVFAGLYERGKVKRPFRLFGFVLLGLVEAFAPMVSLTGLADIWLNVRRLPREGSAKGEPETMSGVD